MIRQIERLAKTLRCNETDIVTGGMIRDDFEFPPPAVHGLIRRAMRADSDALRVAAHPSGAVWPAGPIEPPLSDGELEAAAVWAREPSED